MTQPWHTLPTAMGLLASCALSRPALINCDMTFYRSREEWRCYDPGDPRVMRLQAIQNNHFLEAERAGGREAALIAIGASVDEAIDAVQVEPLIINPNAPDEMAFRTIVRAQIMGGEMEKAA